MADVVARLRLDNKDYEVKLAKAKNSTKEFSQEGVSSISDLMGKFTALAGAVAASKVAMEAFNAVISSSQTIGDAYNRTMEQGKTIVNEFAYSLANADFTRFTNGLSDIRRRAGEAYDALDQLGNTQISHQYVNAQERAKFREGILTAKDTSLSREEREAGISAAKDALARIEETTETLSANTTDYIRKELSKVSNVDVSQVDVDALARALSVDASSNAKELRDDIVAKYEEYQRRYAKEVEPYSARTTTNSYGQLVTNVNYDVEKATANAEALNAEFADTKVLYSALNIISDDLLKTLSQQQMSVEQQKYAMGELVTQLREAENALNKPIKGGTVGAVLTGEQYAQSFGTGFYENLGGGQSFGQKRENAYDQATGGFNATIHEDVPIIDTTDWTEGAIPEMPAIETTNEWLVSMADNANNAAESFSALGSTMSALSSIVGEDAAGWLQWGAGVSQAVAQAIPAIATLTTAKTTEATANTAAAATGAASSQASIPIVGPMMAVDAVASVLAALANLPKFATGGTVPGASLTGDNVLIRANSGERVLTREQNAAYERGMGFGGKVTFEIRGDKLKGVLDNYNKTKAYGVR